MLSFILGAFVLCDTPLRRLSFATGYRKTKIRGFSSAGRAPALQAGGQRFDPANLHQPERVKTGVSPNGFIAQLVRAHA